MPHASLPTLFLSHGAPLLALDASPTARFLDGLGRSLPTPRAIVVISAHYTATRVRVTAGVAPRTLYDFGGFPPELYRIDYPARGEPPLARTLVERLREAGIEAQADAAAGFDHGVWVPLRRMYPDAELPVVALSVVAHADAAWHLGYGAALATLRAEGVLVIGSGGFVHNLGLLGADGTPPSAWAQAFREWLGGRIDRGESHIAADWLARAPYPRLAHPSPEHLLPLFVAWGAAGADSPGRLIHDAWSWSNLGLQCFAFG